MKILVTHASAGAGHRRCAEAISEFIKEETSHRVHLVDCLDYTLPVFKFLYSKGYAFLIAHFPFLWSALFSLTDNHIFFLATTRLRQSVDSWCSRRFIAYLLKEKFDCCICTQFLANGIIARLKKEGRINAKLICVITDYSVHHFWLARGVDIYSVACRETMQRLMRLGISEKNIRVTGIPVNTRFWHQPDRQQLIKKMGLQQGRFTVLLLTGAFGIGPLQKIAGELKDRFQVLVVCGNNKRLLKRLNRFADENIRVYGLVNNIDELMAVSDLVITKPGGLTISETLARHLPMVFIAAIPGQETENAKLMVKYHLAVMVKNLAGLKDIMKRLAADRHRLAYMKANTWRLSKPFAVREILKLVNG
jgi:processive 1,2-diacylglycerol beta-glucosyltransferase